jgi:hypothetical protein
MNCGELQVQSCHSYCSHGSENVAKLHAGDVFLDAFRKTCIQCLVSFVSRIETRLLNIGSFVVMLHMEVRNMSRKAGGHLFLIFGQCIIYVCMFFCMCVWMSAFGFSLFSLSLSLALSLFLSRALYIYVYIYTYEATAKHRLVRWRVRGTYATDNDNN